MSAVLDWIKTNWQLTVPAIVAVFALIQFMINRATQERDRQFKEFHELIANLVKGPTGNAGFIDQQAAIAFGLRHFKRYYPFTLRTLIALRHKWADNPDSAFPRLIAEMDRTIGFLEALVTDPEEKD